MATETPEPRPRRAWGKPLGCLAALAARIARGEPLHVWMGTFNLSGQFVVLLNADGSVLDVSKIDGYVK